MVSIERFSRVVSAVYGAATDPESWLPAMGEVRAAFGGLTAALIEGDGLTRDVKVANLSADAGRSYVQYYRTIDYVMSAVEASPVGLIRGGRTLIALQPRSEFDADWMRPNSLNDGLFVRLSDRRRSTSFLVAGDRGSHDFDTAERISLLNNLIPHLQQALRTERSLRRHAIGRDELSLAIDAVGHGIVVVDSKGEVRQMNCSAARILAERDGVVLQAGTVKASDRATSERLSRSMAEALGRCESALRSGDSILCPRPSGLRPYVIHVVPTEHVDEPARALLVIIDPEQLREPPIDLIRRLFGLTPTEALVAACVLRGEGLAAIGAELSVSLATVKTHLQHVFTKTGTHRQAELVRLLLSVTR